MTIFVSGGAKSGKSSLAQDLTVALSNGGTHYYVATMIPVDEEDRERIRLHLLDRAGMGFETMECGRNILSCLERGEKSAAYLVDSTTALLQNAMFPPEKGYAMDLEEAARCARDLETFARTVENAVIVSDYIYEDAQRYDPGTEHYRKALADADRRLARACDTVLEVNAGQVIVHKGGLPV